MERIEAILRNGVACHVTDIHVQADHIPWWRRAGELVPCQDEAVTLEDMRHWLSHWQLTCSGEGEHLSTAFTWHQGIRCRVHGAWEWAGYHLSLRLLYPLAWCQPDVDASLWQRLALLSSGFVLLTGPTGSGKTTALWHVLQYANTQRPCHIITLEDPIEYVVSSQKALLSQREYGCHFTSFADAVKQALRQDPDIILIGELRDLETMEAALTAAETGHLVLATMHTRTAAQTISRFVGTFPTGRQDEVRQRLSLVLQAIVAQERVWQGESCRFYREILIQTPAVSQLIRTGKDHQLETVLQTGAALGMRTMAQAKQQAGDR